MTLSVSSIGDNQQAPGVLAETYLPDQLIAGDYKIVTDSVTITGGADLVRGSLLGQVTLSAPSTGTAGANTGNGTVTAVSLGAKGKLGTYTIKYTSATAFTVVNPNGVQLAAGVNGAYVDTEINFTATAGGTAFVAGDSFTIAVTAGSGSYKLSTTAATDGSQNPVAILADAALCATNAADQICGIYLTGEFNANAVTFGAGWTAAAAKSALQGAYSSIFLKNVGVLDLTATDPS